MRAAQPWTDERVETLKRLWKKGITAQSIAQRLGGVSRSAVLGKVFRLRLDAAGAAALPCKEKPDDSDATRAHLTDLNCSADPLVSDALPASPPPPARKRGKSLFELTNESCRWPHGRPGTARFFFCGAPGADFDLGMPYCAHHAQRAYARDPGGAAGANAAALPPTDAPARRRRSVWRAPVRHPAARWR